VTGRLARSDCTGPGIRRRRRGRGFSYRWESDGAPVDAETRQRIEALVIPPAWKDVWICPKPNGHIQATGVDAAGRRQYLYHPTWRERRDAAKYLRLVDVGRKLPQARRKIRADLSTRGLNRRRVLAAAVELLDLGFFRVGNDQYADENGSYGLATVLREHVTVSRNGDVVFEYPSKSGRELYRAVAEPEAVAVVRALLRRNDDGPELLAYWENRRWHDVSSGDVNEYLKEIFGLPVSAKDFRTWHATVLAAVGLAVSTRARGVSGRKRAVTRVVREVADYLGNTPAVARSSYIDPRVIDRFLAGETIGNALPRLGKGTREGRLATEGDAERAVVALLS
jgi:DNA topoisomerase IB